MSHTRLALAPVLCLLLAAVTLALWLGASPGARGAVDTTLPTCFVSASNAGPPKTMTLTVQDTGSGIGSITPGATFNASVTVPPFDAGDPATLVVVTQTPDDAIGFVGEFDVSDVAGNVTHCSNDEGAPECTSSGGNFFFFFYVTDWAPGLKSIEVIESENASTLRILDEFGPYHDETVSADVIRLNSQETMTVTLKVTDMLDQSRTCTHTDATPTPSPTPSPTPFVTITLTPSPTPGHSTKTPSPSPTLEPTPTPEPTPSPTPCVEPYGCQPPPPSAPGDADCDTDVDAQDIERTLHWLSGPYSVLVCTGTDANCDQVWDVQDALLVLLYVAEISVQLPASCPPIG